MSQDQARLERALARERATRRQAEAIAEEATRRLYGHVEELKHAQAELERLNAAQRDFIAVASHELLTPLTPIQGFAETLVVRWEALGDVERLRYVGAIRRQADRLALLARDLLTTSKLEGGAIETRIADVPLGDLLRQTVLEAGTAGAAVVSSPDIVVRSDPRLLGQIVSNYVSNAARYGAPPVRVEVAVRVPWIELRVRDHGPGVPGSLAPRLFEKFTQAASMREVGGTGLGLYIVRGLARALGGEAWYEPNSPRGACFGVRVPIGDPVGDDVEGTGGRTWRSAS